MLTVRAVALLRPRTCTSRYNSRRATRAGHVRRVGRLEDSSCACCAFCHDALTIDNVAIHQP